MYSVGFFREALKENRSLKKARHEGEKRISKNYRYIEFKPGIQYECIRDGIPLHDCSPDEAIDELSEDHLFHFRYKDGALERFSSRIPLYVAVLFSKGVYVHPLQRDFKHIYAERTDASRAAQILEDETPYWTDTYILKKGKKEK